LFVSVFGVGTAVGAGSGASRREAGVQSVRRPEDPGCIDGRWQVIAGRCGLPAMPWDADLVYEWHGWATIRGTARVTYFEDRPDLSVVSRVRALLAESAGTDDETADLRGPRCRVQSALGEDEPCRQGRGSRDGGVNG
jgi:hypothetical protein